jgi:glutathione synthase/RimK-type ligase-like ATP-grasp enzyme
MKSYSEFQSVEELRAFYHLDNPILEAKKDEADILGENGNKDEDEPAKVVKSDKLEVNYADLKKTPTNIFKHIIIFTNDNDPKNNKTLKNIYDAVKELKSAKCEIIPELHVFIAADIDADEDESKITITDGDEKMVIEKESNIDTLIFSRLGVQDEDQCEHIVQVLQDRGFLVLNPVRYSALACDKYESALLFKKGDIPQPNFTLMTKEILYDEKLYGEAMKEIYPQWDVKDSDKNEDLSVVMKILDGHGGTGVALIDGKRMYAVLQMIFAIDPEQRILLQKKEEADGGDIRVHVLTLRDKQIILAAMKRVKLGGDFRSNVSLGAEAEPVKLTPEQEQIALKTAQISKLPWCAVDIMPLVKGSNKEIGDNVVLEINASPGTAGISEVIQTNFVNILLNELDDPNSFYLQDKIAGFIESVSIDFGNGVEKTFLAKLDTGNSTKASVLEVGEFKEAGKYIEFSIDGNPIKLEKIGNSNAKAGEEVYERPIVVVPQIILGLRKLNNVPISLVKSRDNKTTNLLLNRDSMSKLGYVVHPNNAHILTKEMEKVKII